MKGKGRGGEGRGVLCVREGSLSLRTSINLINWQSASEELKGGDGEWHASLGRLCAANKKCVSVRQSAREHRAPSARFTPPHSVSAFIRPARCALPERAGEDLQPCSSGTTVSVSAPGGRNVQIGAARERSIITSITGIRVLLLLFGFWKLFFCYCCCLPSFWFLRRVWSQRSPFACGILLLFIEGKVCSCFGWVYIYVILTWGSWNPQMFQLRRWFRAALCLPLP